ncbi:MAG: fumarylacetoacetate hydrolase family protein, partial [Rhodanobacteraceae bacterium]
MRFLSFYRDDRRDAEPGLLEGERIVAIACDSLAEYIALPAGERASRRTDETFALSAVRLAAPVRPRKNVFCVGRNYLEHAKEGARAFGRELDLPDVPTFFSKAPTAIAAPGATLEFERNVSPSFDWEAELAIVIGALA